MDIQSVKVLANTYLVNESLSVPMVPSNRHYKKVVEWLKFNNATPEFTASQLTARAREQAKLARDEAVGNITVTTQSGLVFDGDEKSQGRMARAIIASEPEEATTWVLADNTPALVSREELQEALRLAGEAQTSLWVV